MKRWLAATLCLGLLTGCESVSAVIDDISRSLDSDAGSAAPPPTATQGSGGGGAAQPVSNEFPPAPLPRYSPGDTFTYQEAGQQIREQVLTTTADRVVWTNESGTVWTTLYDVTSPVLSWSGDPELGRGKQEIEGPGPNLFPLAIGRTTDFVVTGQSENRPDGWRVQHSCRVVGAAPIEVEAGRFFTYEIVCQRPDHIETIYYAPAAQTYARRTRAFDTVTVTRDLVDFRFAAERPEDEMTPFQTALATLDGEPMPEPVRRVDPTSRADMATNLQTLERRVAQLERRVDQMLAAEEAAGSASGGDGGNASGDAQEMTGKFGLHLASYRSEESANRGWEVLKRRYEAELGDLGFTLKRFTPRTGRGDFFRLIAGGFETKAEADQACRPLRNRRQYCQALQL